MWDSNRFSPRSVAGLAFVLLVGCGVHEQAEVASSAVVYSFEGAVEDGEIRLWGIPTVDPAATGDDFSSDLARRQELTAVTEDQNGTRGTASVATSIEMTIQRDAPYTAPVLVANGCGPGNTSFDVTVGVRNFDVTRLSNAHLEIISITDTAGNPSPGIGDHSLCNSEPSTPNLIVGATPVSNALGLIRYGNLAADPNGFATLPPDILPEPLGTDATAHAMLWRFQNGSGAFKFRGRVVADVCAAGDCVPGAVTGHSAAIAGKNPRAWDTNGTVQAITEGAGVAYIGGTFTRVGPRTGAAFAAADDVSGIGAAQSSFPAFEGGIVNTIAPDGAGGAWVGGSFTSGGNLQGRLVHVLASGEIDPAFTVPSSVTDTGTVQALALDPVGGNLWVGRSQTPFLVALNATTGIQSLTPLAPSGSVRKLVVVGTRVILSGTFSNYGVDAARNNRDGLAIITAATGAIDTTFAVPVSDAVETFVTDGATVWLGGVFTNLGVGVLRNRLAAVDIATSSVLAWNPGADGAVNAMALSTAAGVPVVTVGGAFANVRATARSRLAAIEANPTVAAPVLRAWAPVVNSTVHSVTVDGPDVLLGGAFTLVNGVSRSRLAAISGSVDIPTAAVDVRAFNPSANATARVITLDPASGRILVGGDFTTAGGTLKNRIAAISLTSGDLVPTFNASIDNGSVGALSLAGGRLWVGGTFTLAAGLARSNLAAFEPTSGALDAVSLAPNNTVFALASNATHVYVGGSFTSIGGIGRARLARISLAGAVDASWAPSLTSGQVNAVVVDGGAAYAGGTFTTPVTRLARFNLTNGALLTNYAANGTVNALAVRHQRLFVGGLFTALGGGSRTNLAAISTETNTLSAAFSPAAPDLVVRAVSVAGNSVVVGGDFLSPRQRLASFDNVSGATQSFTPFPVNQGTSINAVAVVGGFVVAGGVAVTSPGREITTTGTAINRARRASLFMVHAE